jgi:hypothetical protein
MERRIMNSLPWELKDLPVANIHPTLAVIAEQVKREFGLNVITSAFRLGDSGVHGTQPVRGLDLRCWDTDLGFRVAEWVNARWAYDPDRPGKQCALYHNAGSGVHLHLQAHPKTVLRPPLAA